MNNVKLELFMIFESYIKGSIDCYMFIGIQLLTIPKLKDYGYEVELALFDDE